MKIGIITHFNKSTNYGGVLQAYALTKKLDNLGYDAEQISYKATCKNLNVITNSCQKSLTNKIKRVLRGIKIRLCKIISYKSLKNSKTIAISKQDCFKLWTDENVKSSKVVYNQSNIAECNNLYDAFVAGSDQVWNYTWYDKNYFLDFANNSKIKLSYGASLGHNKIPNSIKEVYSAHLKSFNAVSVREQNMVDLFESISPVNVEWVVDPVFLLGKEEWNDAISNTININEKYVFCYFLGHNKKERKIVNEFARKKSLKVVTIQDLMMEYGVKLNENFADIKLKNVNPGEFLYLIKNAEYVFTDSFHATAFSLIYQKQFFVFNRYSGGGMSDRITNVTNLFDATERFCVGKNESLEYVNSLNDIDYSNKKQNFEKIKKSSIEFLLNALKE